MATSDDPTCAWDAGVLAVLDRARGFQRTVDVRRLERLLEIYRSWVTVPSSVEGGFGLTRDELACVLEYPADPGAIAFLLETFGDPDTERVDLLTLVATTACLARGGLEDRARVVFELVDFDTEDEIVEEELALVIAMACRGLARLGILTEEVHDEDARAIAYEAFGFVGIDDGDKMPLGLFTKWLVFHPRPRGLFMRISCLLALNRHIETLHLALEHQQRRIDSTPFSVYNEEHFSPPGDQEAEVCVLVGPIVGKVTETSIRLLLEVNVPAKVRCFAFRLNSPDHSNAVVHTFELGAGFPHTLLVTGLVPGVTYLLRFLGIRAADRRRCVAYATTCPAITRLPSCHELQQAQPTFQLLAVNHASEYEDRTVFQRLQQTLIKATVAETQIVLVHFSFVRIPWKRALELITLLAMEENEGLVEGLLAEEFRVLLNQKHMFELGRIQSNLFFCSIADVVLGGCPFPIDQRDTIVDRLLTLSKIQWERYIGSLWSLKMEPTQVVWNCQAAIVLSYNTNIASSSQTEGEVCSGQLFSALKSLDLASDIVLLSSDLVAPSSEDKTGRPCTDPPEIDALFNVLSPLIEWKRHDLERSVTILSPWGYGAEYVFDIKSTTLSLTQYLCGPIGGVVVQPSFVPGSRNCGSITITQKSAFAAPHIGVLTWRVRVAHHSRPGTQTVSRPNSEGSPILNNVRPTVPTKLESGLMYLENRSRVRAMIGPIFGQVTPTTATILIELNESCSLPCKVSDTLTGRSSNVWVFGKKREVCSTIIDNLEPGHLYRVSFEGIENAEDGYFQTPTQDTPTTRIVVLAGDTFCAGHAFTRRELGQSKFVVASSMGSLVQDLAGVSGGMMLYDMTVRLGSMGSLSHDLIHGFEMIRPSTRSEEVLDTVIGEIIRRNFEEYSDVTDNRILLSRGCHVLSTLGVCRDLIQSGVSVMLMKAVKRALEKYDNGYLFTDSRLNASDMMGGGRVKLIMLDTTDSIGTCDSSPFIQWSEQLLTRRQRVILSLALSHLDTPNQVIIFCDAPFVWPYRKTARQEHVRDMVEEIAKDPWSHYPYERISVFEEIFERMAANPLLHVMLICCGPFATRSAIVHNMTQKSVEQVTIGPISSPPGSMLIPVVDYSTVGSLFLEKYTVTSHPSAVVSPIQQYCMVDLAPHHQGPASRVEVFTNQLPCARIIVGPILGRVTSRSARILIETDRRAEKVVCKATTTISTEVVSSERNVIAFLPTVFKLDGLQPGMRYTLQFEGIHTTSEEGLTSFETPPLKSLAAEFLLVRHNNLRAFIGEETPTDSSWRRIVQSGTRHYTARISSEVALANGDTLGDCSDLHSPSYNPWFHVEAMHLSDPLRHPQLAIHLGGQVDLSATFSEAELGDLVWQLCDPSVGDDMRRQTLTIVRARMQETYRVAWGVAPFRQMLCYTSNIMLLDEETDIFFSMDRIRSAGARRSSTVLAEDQVQEITNQFRQIAFELWQLYQNQLWVDVNESDLDNTRRNSTKFSYVADYGLCRLAFLNISDELRSCTGSHADNSMTPQKEAVPPLSLSSVTEGTSRLNLFSSATWKTLDGALGNNSEGNYQGNNRGEKISHIIVAVPVDFPEVIASIPSIRPEFTDLLEKLFSWKVKARQDRQITLICASSQCSSVSFVVTDEITSETITMTRIGSISEARGLANSNQNLASRGATRGYFSKRYTYHNTSHGDSKHMKQSVTDQSPVWRSRCYASYQFISDFRRGFLNENILYFPPLEMPKALLGPVVGRLGWTHPLDAVSDDVSPVELTFNVPIMLEVNAAGRVTCSVTDSLTNKSIRVSVNMKMETPCVFYIYGLAPHRRYVYQFEGISNSEERRGSFHTPPQSMDALRLVVVSSNFPTHLDDAHDSLWMRLYDRVKIPWCGIDAIMHLGGQVPLHEAFVQCFDWVRLELSHPFADDNSSNSSRENSIRQRIRRRFQQEYRLSWNLPGIRELLATCPNIFLRGQADVAPFFSNRTITKTAAARMVLECAVDVVRMYQNVLNEVPKPPTVEFEEQIGEKGVHLTEYGGMNSIQVESKPAKNRGIEEGDPLASIFGAPPRTKLALPTTDGGVFWTHGDIGVFMCDIRADLSEDPITCNQRLQTPLAPREHAVIGELQWNQLEVALKKKHVMFFILCLELPLILTNPIQVDKLRRDFDAEHQDQSGHWPLYDHRFIYQHWVVCRRQLEQLLILLFKWKAKRRGRDVVILSGGMKIGIETVIIDKGTKLSIRNFTAGPITANVEPFEFPVEGIACPTFTGGNKDDHFTFSHSLLSTKNYLLLQISVQKEATRGELTGRSSGENGAEPTVITEVIAEFVPDDVKQFERIHPIRKFCCFPLWWNTYIPMGKQVFWDDTIVLKSITDDEMVSLRQYIHHDRGFAGALEVFYEKYQFAETARMENLRSRRTQFVNLRKNFMAVVREVWRIIPESKRQQMSYFLDPFVFDILIDHVAPGVWNSSAIELEYFGRIIREFVMDACILRLAVETQNVDARLARLAELEEQRKRKQIEEEERIRKDEVERDEAKKMTDLMHSNPEEYAKIILAREEAIKQEQEVRHQEKMGRKRAERLAELEEEKHIAKEQKRLNKLAEQDPEEYERRRKALEIRIWRLDEKRQQRVAQKAMKGLSAM